LNAELRKLHEEARDLGPNFKALQTLTARFEAECGHALAEAPHRPVMTETEFALGPMEIEALDYFLGVTEREKRGVYIRFQHEVRVLAWPSRPLTRVTHESALEHVEQADIEVPNLCADLRAWAATGYTKLPEETLHLAHEFQRIISITTLPLVRGEPQNASVEAAIERRLKPFEDGEDRRLARRVKQVRVALRRQERSLLNAADAQIHRLEGKRSP
jgi:hypothetical protein